MGSVISDHRRPPLMAATAGLMGGSHVCPPSCFCLKGIGGWLGGAGCCGTVEGVLPLMKRPCSVWFG